MGRIKVAEINKKLKTGFSIDESLLKKLHEIGIKNESKLINWLLKSFLEKEATNEV